jgi:hypothetical protein
MQYIVDLLADATCASEWPQAASGGQSSSSPRSQLPPPWIRFTWRAAGLCGVRYASAL